MRTNPETRGKEAEEAEDAEDAEEAEDVKILMCLLDARTGRHFFLLRIQRRETTAPEYHHVVGGCQHSIAT